MAETGRDEDIEAADIDRVVPWPTDLEGDAGRSTSLIPAKMGVG